MEKFKVLTISDLGVSTGFARVMTEIINNFPKDWEINSLAINYFGDPHELNAKLYPASPGGDLYGIGRLGNLIEKIVPDKIFILQDSWIIQKYLEVMPEEYLEKTVIYTPVDAGPYMPEWVEKFPQLKHICVYTEFGKHIILDANPNIKNITVIPHGINTDMFFPIPQEEAREKIGQLTDDLYITLNVNRNQPRKKLDLCAKAFGIFARDKPEVRYYHHAGVEDVGWNIVKLAKRYGFEKRLILSSKKLSPQRGVSNETLNLIYNTANIGLNLSSGEGWGLCFKEGTDVLTTSGFKKIENVGANDYVFDAKGYATRVKNTLVRDLDSTIYKIKISGLADYIYVTGEHPFLTQEGFTKVKDLTTKSRVLKPDITDIDSFSRVDLTHYAPFVHDDSYIYFIDTGKRFGNKIKSKELLEIKKLFNANVSRSSVRKINRYLPLNADTVEILYYFLSTKTKTYNFSHTPGIEVALKRLFNYRDALSSRKPYSEREGRAFNLGNNLTLALKRIARSQHTYLALDRELLVGLFTRIIKNNSYSHPTTGALLLSSKKFYKSRIYRTLLVRLGVASSEFYIKDGTLYISVNKKHLPEFFKCNSNRNRTEDLEGFYYRVTQIEQVPYIGKVYNLETESHTYNVYGYAVHNCNMEHSITGKPQILSGNSASIELYKDDRAILVPINHYETNTSILTEGGVVSLEHAVAAMEYAYTHQEEMKEMGSRAREYFLQDKFKWSNISDTFRKIIES